VVSSSRSEAVKGFVTRVGTRIVKGVRRLLLLSLPVDHERLIFKSINGIFREEERSVD
jgi:hypothetical protein